MITGFKCTICHKTYENTLHSYTCPECGDKGILDVLYDYHAIGQQLTKDVLASRKEKSIWRYKELLPVDPEYTKGTLQVGCTPLYLSNKGIELAGIKNLYIKDEGLNPTASLKDRASVIAVVKALEEGQKVVACSSTGNAASSLAGNAAKVGLKTVIFVPERAPIGKLTQLLVYGAMVLSVEGDYKATYDMSKIAIDHYGFYNRNAAINPYLVEGKKTVAYEIAEQMDFIVPDWVAVSVGDGCTIGGVYKGFFDLIQIGLIDKMPKLLGVQAKGCAPLYEAFHTDREVEEADENTLADSISVGMPRNPIKALEAVKKSQGTYVKVSDEAILKAIAELGRLEGVFSEPAAAASLAGIKVAVESGIISKEETVVMISTGNGLKDTVNGMKACKEPILLKPDKDQLIKKLESYGL